MSRSNSRIAPQRQTYSGGPGDAPAKGGVKGRATDPPVAQQFRKILHRKLGELARGSVRTTGHGSMAATKVPKGSQVTQAGRTVPSRGQKMTAAARNGVDTGVVGPSITLTKKAGVASSARPPRGSRGSLEAHRGGPAKPLTRGGRKVRQPYGG